MEKLTIDLVSYLKAGDCLFTVMGKQRVILEIFFKDGRLFYKIKCRLWRKPFSIAGPKYLTRFYVDEWLHRELINRMSSDVKPQKIYKMVSI